MCSAFPQQDGWLLRLQTEEHASISPEEQLQCPGYLLTVLRARNFSCPTVLSTQESRKTGKGLAQDSERSRSSQLAAWFYAAGEVSPQTRRKQRGYRGGRIPPFTLGTNWHRCIGSGMMKSKKFPSRGYAPARRGASIDVRVL